MSDLTLRLLHHKRQRNARKWQRIMEEASKILVAEYGTPTLGNFRDPVKEIVYIVLSAKTTELLYQAAQKRLWKRFRDLEGIATAPITLIHECIANAGLGAKRAEQIKAIARRLIADFGKRPSQGLRRLSADDAYLYLTSLPGVGPKSALCVMMYSMNEDVFPVDANIHRILRRMGAIKPGAKHYHAQARLPAFIPEGKSRSLHVALVLHGRQICKPRTPLCEDCKISHLCSTGIKRLGLGFHSPEAGIASVVPQIADEQGE